MGGVRGTDRTREGSSTPPSLVGGMPKFGMPTHLPSERPPAGPPEVTRGLRSNTACVLGSATV